MIGAGLIALYVRESFKERNIRIKIAAQNITKPALIALFTVLSLMISSFFWLPLFVETKFVNLVNHPWPLSYDRFFLTYKQLWSSPWGFNGFTEPQPMSLQIGKTFIVFSALILSPLLLLCASLKKGVKNETY